MNRRFPRSLNSEPGTTMPEFTSKKRTEPNEPAEASLSFVLFSFIELTSQKIHKHQLDKPQVQLYPKPNFRSLQSICAQILTDGAQRNSRCIGTWQSLFHMTLRVSTLITSRYHYSE